MREEMTRSGMSNVALSERVAELTGGAVTLHVTAVPRVQRGEQKIYLEQAVAIAAVLEVELAELLSVSPQMSAEAALARARERLAELDIQRRSLDTEHNLTATRIQRLERIVGTAQAAEQETD